MSKIKMIASAAALAGLGAFAVASAGSPEDKFKKYDTNADGVVTEAEFVAVKTEGGKYTAEEASAKFAKVAGDDGEMTLAEMEAAVAAHKAAKAEKEAKPAKKSYGS